MTSPSSGQLPTVAFGVSPEQQNELAALVATGVKRATTSVLGAYHDEDEPLPERGELAWVVDGAGCSVCIIRTTSVEIRRYAEVDEAHALLEGEGDRSLTSWRVDHQPFFDDVCDALGIPFGDDLELVLERFEVVRSRTPG